MLIRVGRTSWHRHQFDAFSGCSGSLWCFAGSANIVNVIDPRDTCTEPDGALLPHFHVELLVWSQETHGMIRRPICKNYCTQQISKFQRDVALDQTTYEQPTHAEMLDRAANFILSNYSQHASISSMKATLALPELSLHRKCFRLYMFCKIYHYNMILKDNLFSAPVYVSSHSDHNYQVRVPSCQTNTYSEYFIPKASKE